MGAKDDTTDILEAVDVNPNIELERLNIVLQTTQNSLGEVIEQLAIERVGREKADQAATSLHAEVDALRRANAELSRQTEDKGAEGRSPVRWDTTIWGDAIRRSGFDQGPTFEIQLSRVRKDLGGYEIEVNDVLFFEGSDYTIDGIKGVADTSCIECNTRPSQG